MFLLLTVFIRLHKQHVRFGNHLIHSIIINRLIFIFFIKNSNIVTKPEMPGVVNMRSNLLSLILH